MAAHTLPSPRRCPICYEILDPLGIVRLEGGGYISEYKLGFLELAWDVGYLTHLYFHPPVIKPTKAEWTLKVKGGSTLFSIVAVLVCIPTNSVRGFPFLHTLSSIYCL